jgi:hypothetical protein
MAWGVHSSQPWFEVCNTIHVLTVNSCIKVRLWLASGQVSRRSQGTLLPSSGEPKVRIRGTNVWRKSWSSKAK